MSDLFFLAFGPLCFLVPVAFFLVLFLRFQRRKKTDASPGAKPGPAQTNPLLKQVADRLFDDLGLPSQEFRRELGVKYPELAMAFRQSVNFGLIRYTRQHWHREPDAAMQADLLNRLLCDYYGIILPANCTLEDVQNALSIYFKQKKMLYKVRMESTERSPALIVTDRDQALFRLETVPEQPDRWAVLFQALAPRLDTTGTWQPYLFRNTGNELGLVFAEPAQYESRLKPLEQLPVSGK
jgi:hypothetical protein